MSLLLHVVESWAEGLLRIVIGVGLVWIGVVEGAGYGTFLGLVGAIFIAAGVAEIWFVEAAVHRLPWRRTMNTIQPAVVTCDVPVFYATTEGQTRRIAERLVALFNEKGLTSRAVDVASSEADYVEWSRVRAAVVGASLHAQRHQRSARAFIRRNVERLNRHPSAFFSVSMSTASAREQERQASARIASELPATLGWHPYEVVCLAGRLAYTKYGFLTRLIMKGIAQRQGGPTDTTRDHEFTNWDDVAHLAENVVAAATVAAHKVA